MFTMMNVARLGNKYLADEEPWKVIKQDRERVRTIMYVALQIAAGLAVLSEPFLPFTSAKLKNMLNLSDRPAARLRTDLVKLEWNDIEKDAPLLRSGYHIEKAELLFRKIEDDEIQKQLDKLAATKKSNALADSTSKDKAVSAGNADTKTAPVSSTDKNTVKTPLMPQKETISYDDFSKLDMRVGTIVQAEKMPKTDKLMVLQVDTGLDTRTIVSGIAESFTAEEIVGKKVTVLINLAPRKLRGVESQGMILMTENADGKLVFVNPDASATGDTGSEGVLNGVEIN